MSFADNLNPLPLPAIFPDEKSADSIVPSLCNTKFPPVSVSEPNVQPAIVPPVAVISPAVSTSNLSVFISNPVALNLIKFVEEPTKLNLPVPSI